MRYICSVAGRIHYRRMYRSFFGGGLGLSDAVESDPFSHKEGAVHARCLRAICLRSQDDSSAVCLNLFTKEPRSQLHAHEQNTMHRLITQFLLLPLGVPSLHNTNIDYRDKTQHNIS